MKIDLNKNIQDPRGNTIVTPDGTITAASILADILWNADEKRADRAIKLVDFSRALVKGGEIECETADLELIREHVGKSNLTAGARVQVLEALKASST